MVEQQRTWIAVELTSLGEQRLDEGKLEHILRSNLPSASHDHPIFVPSIQVHKEGRPFIYRLMEGYIFIASGLPEIEYLRLERIPYVASVMTSMSMEGIRICSRIPDEDVGRLQAQLKEQANGALKPGTWVKIINGTYTHMEGEILATREGKVDVYLELRSLRMIISLPNSSVDVLEDQPEPSAPLPFDKRFPRFARPLSVFETHEVFADDKDPTVIEIWEYL